MNKLIEFFREILEEIRNLSDNNSEEHETTGIAQSYYNEDQE